MAEQPSRSNVRTVARRAAIIAISRAHFFEHGFDRTSMSAIAKDMGGSKTTLWKYFASKDELFAAMLDDATFSFCRSIADALNSGENIANALTDTAENFITRVTGEDGIALQRLIIGEVDRFPKIGRMFYDRGPAAIASLLTDYFGDRMEMGEMRRGDASEAASMFIDLCSGKYHQRVLWGLEIANERDIKRESMRVVRYFMRCYVDYDKS